MSIYIFLMDTLYLQQRYQYKSFESVTVNRDWIWEDATINILLEQASRALGELNAFSLIVPDNSEVS